MRLDSLRAMIAEGEVERRDATSSAISSSDAIFSSDVASVSKSNISDGISATSFL